jgi:hypothetical protein
MYEQTVVILFRYHGAAHPQVTAVLSFCFTAAICDIDILADMNLVVVLSPLISLENLACCTL